DIDAGVDLVNTATVTTTQVPGPTSDTATTPVVPPQLVVNKTSSPASGTAVVAGDTITYTLTATVADAALSSALVLEDTISAGLVFDTVTANPGGFAVNSAGVPLLFTLPAGTAPGTYSVSYALTVDAAATVAVGNVVVPNGGGDPDPECPSCSTSHPVTPQISATKTSNPADGSSVVAGQTITYTLTLDVTNGPTTAAVVLTDTLDAQLENVQLVNAGGFTLASLGGGVYEFTLGSGAASGSYQVVYSADVVADATGSVGNAVVASGGGDPDPECPSCTTSHPVADPAIVVAKTSNPASGTTVTAGETITYTLT
ncbi:hypothetical protein HFP89_00015, partial [Wenzhouxiangella sp. XN79A]|uniref:DUF7927 domain-containing protein n=1 Tax=Wenzhouxiangella sp. XN79A TaxID=2724193 RepID=UPI0016A6B698